MILRIFVWIVLAMLLLNTDGYAVDPIRVRVLSWNIHHGEGVDGRLDLERIASVIKEVDPDIVALQEVDKGCTRSNRVDQPAELGRLTGLTPVFQKNINHQGGEYGNAVLSNWPIEAHRNVSLPCLNNGEQRGALAVELLLPQSKKRLTFISTHLDHRPVETERLASADAINAMVADLTASHCILAGDLNAEPDSAVLDSFRMRWINTAEKPLPTIPVGQPSTQIDYILMLKPGKWKVLECRVLDEAIASDHRAIFAVVELRGQE